MYFKKLELIGFKSFYDKTTLQFEPGITAVVGPNGCGKSNIFDSIRWVLGEQSAKSLRGSDMQDVIFSGTDAKEPLGMAEVTLTFDNEKRFFNIDHPEVNITRRLFRSGESEYMLNKTSVRLKDILDLLLGTGIGAESYSIVAQGKIDMVLSSRPEDRRLVFDEASGITKYKAQKRETTRRLEETEQNLLRVNDIITEVKRQISSLERQANKARKYKEVFEELKDKETCLALLQKTQLLAQKRALLAQIEELESQEGILQETIHQLEQAIASRQGELKAHEENKIAIRNQILNLENQAIRSKEHARFNRERITELDENLKYLVTQSEQIKARIELDEEKLKSLREEFAGLENAIAEKSAILSEKEVKINEISLAIKNSLDSISQSKKSIMELVSDISHAKNEISDFNAKREIHLAREKRLEIEKAKVYEEKAITEASLNTVTKEVEDIKGEVGGIQRKIISLKTEWEQEKVSLAQINASMDGLEKEKLTLESHKEFLGKLKNKYEDISEVSNAVIYLDKMPAEDLSGLVVKIKDRMSMGLEDKVVFAQAQFKLSGEAKPVELDTHAINEKLAKIKDSLEILKTERHQKETIIEEQGKTIASLQEDLRNKEITLANKESARTTILEQFSKIKDEEDLIVMELADIQKEISVLGDNLKVAQAHWESCNDEHRKTEDRIKAEEESISKNAKLREETLVLITQTKTELDSLRKRLVSDEATLKILQDSFSQEKNNLSNIEKQILEGQTRKESMEKEIAECLSSIEEANREIQQQKMFLKDIEVRFMEASKGFSNTVKKIDSDKEELDTIKNRVYESQMQLKDIEYKYASVRERMLAAYKVDVEGLEEPVTDTDKDTDGLSQEIESLKAKVDSYGTVNLVAIEEYDELKKRYDFLIQQQNDLLSSKEALHQAILKINRTTKQMFLETFEKVRLEFRNYFRLLFNGGDAQIFLVDEHDPLESGIEIICRPPGKKLQNVLLLSGGEKSLSAIALIFAIFKVKPAPFCILDEIDAALDEANVDRFSRLLQEFAGHSQFIVITHNKRTITNADVMYGITMEESGLSKIVSVKFSKDLERKDKKKEPEGLVPEPV
ncbi:MAG: hypothetical protein AMJ95_00895 [Omnitrophica WOR_2 bacterium SM23_72]|nr:MAG: hypothetical protein AMJ95_00895 [Omnitrophica WOR_2 bacterium SM23_72]